MSLSRSLILTGLTVLIVSCSPEPAAVEEPALPEEVPTEQAPTALHFVDATQASGLGAFQQRNGSPTKSFIDESFGAGVALVDVDGDGDLDAYLTNGCARGEGLETTCFRDALYLNDGSGQFRDATDAAGLGDDLWTYGVSCADYDGDGDQDIYITNNGPNRLYRNRGDGTFDEVGEAAGVDCDVWSSGSVFFDYDRDGDLDLYVVNHIQFDAQKIVDEKLSMTYFDLEVYYGPLGLEGEADRLYRNNADGTFTDVSEESGIGAVEMFGFHAVTYDYDGDGWQDLYVANDSNPNLLWRNNGAGGFEDVAVQANVALGSNGDPQAGMGVALGDFNNDLAADLFVTNFSEDYFTLYQRQSSRGLFRDVTTRVRLYQVTLPDLGWGCGFEDFDCDGDLDLFAVNGHVFPQVDSLGREETPYLQRNQLFENEQNRFKADAGIGGPGFELKAASRGSAVGDVDGDGDRDLLIGNLDGPPTLLLNSGQAPGQHLNLTLVGAGLNRDAIGARVVAQVGEQKLVRFAGAGSGFLSSNSHQLHFGLGAATAVQGLEVLWPDGTQESFGETPAGNAVIRQGSGSVDFESSSGGR